MSGKASLLTLSIAEFIFVVMSAKHHFYPAYARETFCRSQADLSYSF